MQSRERVVLEREVARVPHRLQRRGRPQRHVAVVVERDLVGEPRGGAVPGVDPALLNHPNYVKAASTIEGIDLFISYWEKEWMAHTFLSFRFKNAEPVCVSIEGRLEKGETFAALPGVFKRFELIYVLGDERERSGGVETELH